MSEERPAARQGFFSLVPSWHDPEVHAQDKPCCPASRDNPDYLGTTPMDEFEPKVHVLHNVSGYVLEWLVLELDPLQLYLRNAAQTKATVLSTRTVRG